MGGGTQREQAPRCIDRLATGRLHAFLHSGDEAPTPRRGDGHAGASSSRCTTNHSHGGHLFHVIVTSDPQARTPKRTTWFAPRDPISACNNTPSHRSHFGLGEFRVRAGLGNLRRTCISPARGLGTGACTQRDQWRWPGSHGIYPEAMKLLLSSQIEIRFFVPVVKDVWYRLGRVNLAAQSGVQDVQQEIQRHDSCTIPILRRPAVRPSVRLVMPTPIPSQATTTPLYLFHP